MWLYILILWKKRKELKREISYSLNCQKIKKEKSIGTFEMISHAVDPFGFGA